MILKGSQRSGAGNLSAHLMNDRDNDHVTLFELRGFVGKDLHEALAEAHAISKGTKCQQFMFSLSLNPPKEADPSTQDFVNAIDRAEHALGLDNQPRAIVFHEKEGRHHAHVVWSRIDAQSMKAINLPHFKNKLKTLARELFLEHDWELPNGLRRDGGKSPLNFTLDEWQQAKRLKLDPREIKQSFIEAWQRSDSIEAFEHALEERGYFLARGDRRGLVALDVNGEVFSVPRMIGIKAKEVKAKLGDPDMLRSVDGTKQMIVSKVDEKVREFIDDVDQKHENDFKPLHEQRAAMVTAHREERARLKDAQKARWHAESMERSSRLNKGFKGLWDLVRGKATKIKKQNELEAWECSKRDRAQRDELIKAQMLDRRLLQAEIDKLRRKHVQERKILMLEVRQSIEMSYQDSEIKSQELQINRDQKHDLKR